MTSGRVSTFNQATADYICEQLAEGRSLREIIREDDGMPALSTVFKWLADHVSFSDQYTRAREVQAEALVDQIIEISDDGTNDYMEKRDADGGLDGWRENGEAIARSRLRVDARKWVAAKMAPKKYSDKIVQEMVGKDGGPIEVAHTARDRIAYRLAKLAPEKPSEGGPEKQD